MSEAALAASSEGSAVLSIDPEFKTLIPPLSAEERAGLEASIVAEGCRDAIVIWNGTIVDGHNRYEICRNHGIGFRTEAREFPAREAVILWIIENQLARRNISDYSRVSLLLKKEEIIAQPAKENQRVRKGNQPGATRPKSDKLPVRNTAKTIAKIAGVGRTRVAQVQKIEEKATEEIKEKLVSGELSINDAYKKVRAAEKSEQKQLAFDAIQSLTEPNGRYHVLVVDPPWQYGKRAEDPTHRGRCLYPTMVIDDVCAMEIPAEDDAVLWLWTTNAFMHEAYHVLDSWGFEPKTILTWVKDRWGTGDWLRGQTEHCILAIKGKPVVKSEGVSTVLEAPLRQHSRKPDEFYDLVDEMCPGRKIDIFSREAREGWDQWGAEVDSF